MAVQHGWEGLLESFPAVDCALAYGSAVFEQPGLYERGQGGAAPMLDFLLVVDNPLQWHTEVQLYHLELLDWAMLPSLSSWQQSGHAVADWPAEHREEPPSLFVLSQPRRECGRS